MIRRLSSAAALLAAVAAASAAHAQPAFPPAATAPAGVSPKVALPDAELERNRGGYLVANGLALDFAAVTRTFVDGSLALETHLSWGDNGAQIQQATGNSGAVQGATLNPAALGALTAAGINPSQVTNSTYSTPDGQSQVIQRVGSDFLTNMVLNSASNRAISQDTQITLTLPGFQATQQQMSTAMRAAQIATDVANGALLGLRR